MLKIGRPLLALYTTFYRHEGGGVAVLFGLALLPLTLAAGTALDFSKASAARAQLSVAADAAVLAAAIDRSESWNSKANAVFDAHVAGRDIQIVNRSFTLSPDGVYSGSVQASVSALLVKIAGITTIDVTSSSAASKVLRDDQESCILTLDSGGAATNESLRFNGAPRVRMDGCAIRSNSSMACNGHDGGASISFAVGSANGCSSPVSNAREVIDNFAQLARHITQRCNGSRPGITWRVGTTPTGPGIIASGGPGFSSFHICGDLTLEGTGNLSSSNTVIVVENGSIILSPDADVTAREMTLVLTGNVAPGSINFPNGNGHGATLSVSPPVFEGNPWRGISVFQDPSVSTTLEADWGPGGTFKADGVVYMSKTNLTLQGNASSGNSRCTKFVVNTFRTNGSVELNFSRSGACHSMGMARWSDEGVRLTR